MLVPIGLVLALQQASPWCATSPSSPTTRSPTASSPAHEHGRTVRLTGESVGRGSPYRARSGGTWEVSAWRRPIRLVVMVGSERFPARGCRSNERATGSGPACPYLRKLSRKALLYRCAVSRAGSYGRLTAVTDRGLLGAVMRWSASVVGAGGVDLRFLHGSSLCLTVSNSSGEILGGSDTEEDGGSIPPAPTT